VLPQWLYAQLPNKTGLPKIQANQNAFEGALTLFFGIVAALAILSIVIAGFNFVTSDGDPEKISRSKKTILLSLIGLIIALSAEAIVFLVIRNI
jgi:hypothetical protein